MERTGIFRTVQVFSVSARYVIARTVVDSYPLGWWYCLARKPYRGSIPGAETVITIEGYPRSANSFTAEWARLALGRESAVAGHSHSAALAIASLKKGTPCVVLLRRPFDAVGSHVQYRSGLTTWAALYGYVSFYRRFRRYVGSFAVLTFEEVTGDVAAALERVERDGLPVIPPFSQSETNIALVKQRLEHSTISRHGFLDESKVPRVSTRRKSSTAAVGDFGWFAERLHRRAENIYDELRRGSD